MNAHVTEEQLQALSERALPEEDAARVEEHCRECARCARLRDDALALVDALRADAEAAPLRPVWPHVQRRLRTGLPRLDAAFALGAGLAVTAGVLIGLVLGASTLSRSNATYAASTASSSQATLSVFDEPLGSSLPDVYGLSTETGGNGS